MLDAPPVPAASPSSADAHASIPRACGTAHTGGETAGTGLPLEPGAYVGCRFCEEWIHADGTGHRLLCRVRLAAADRAANRPVPYRGEVEVTRWEEEAA